MIESREGVNVATVEENLSCFTKREIEQARKARELLVNGFSLSTASHSDSEQREQL
jgi:hypothetical protein